LVVSLNCIRFRKIKIDVCLARCQIPVAGSKIDNQWLLEISNRVFQNSEALGVASFPQLLCFISTSLDEGVSVYSRFRLWPLGIATAAYER
jgi:hypothetical protein